MSDYVVSDTTLTSIANAIRQKGGTSTSLTFPQGFVDAIGEISGGGEITPWVRPEDWPDIDALAAQVADDEDCVYLTYDLRKTPGYGWIGIAARNDVNNTDWYVERGHVASGAFVADETHSITTTNRNADTYFRQVLDSADGDVQLWRVRTANRLTNVKFATNTATPAKNFNCNMQPCVERSGKLPHMSNLSGGAGSTAANSTSIGTVWLERDALVPGKLAVVTNMNGTWQNCYNLVEIDLSGWDTSGWAVTTLQSCWNSCYSLQSLDLTGLDTSGWAVTALSSTWSNCRKLQSLDLSHWNTSGWEVVQMSSMMESCSSLKEVDFSGWDTSNWRVKTMPSFSNCYNLESLDVSGWDVSNWPVTSVTNMFRYTAIRDLDFSTWDTSGWQLTSATSPFDSMIKLERLKGLENWTWTANLTTTIYPSSATNLIDFSGVALSVNHSYSNSSKLTRQSLLNILNVLPTVTAARTITLGQVNKSKLTAEEIAIATAKGWTVA